MATKTTSRKKKSNVHLLKVLLIFTAPSITQSLQSLMIKVMLSLGLLLVHQALKEQRNLLHLPLNQRVRQLLKSPSIKVCVLSMSMSKDLAQVVKELSVPQRVLVYKSYQLLIQHQFHIMDAVHQSVHEANFRRNHI